ncbi:MAG: carboxypeptidase-like regulatory domain-containing protein [Bacteroidetes bacterium]|nr:carboxypeptidase-like regulatory domain-containing protein [Bacteroidota bacterium]
MLALCLVLAGQQAFSQITIRGTVYNMNRSKPLQSVSVVSTSGNGVVTDSNGNYIITVREGDSISFSYLGRHTMKYPASMISQYTNFDVALHVEPTELRQVQVMPRDYHMDSLQNRQDYAKIFDYKKPGLKITEPGVGGTGVGFDLDEIIEMFQFNKKRRMLAFQQRLLQEERDNFIDHRFSKLLVKKITHATGAELDSFMRIYRPSFNFTQTSTDYDFETYIKLAYREYKRYKQLGEMRKQRLPF